MPISPVTTQRQSTAVRQSRFQGHIIAVLDTAPGLFWSPLNKQVPGFYRHKSRLCDNSGVLLWPPGSFLKRSDPSPGGIKRTEWERSGDVGRRR